MEVRKTRPEELDAVMELYDQGRRFMRQNGNQNQWIKGYPSRELVQEDIRLGRSYVAEEDGMLDAVFCFFYGENADPTYADIDGAWIGHGPYGVLHRIASSGRVPGMVDKCSDWCLEQWPDLRIDTHRDNQPMQRALERCGFQFCGVVTIEDGSERMAYEKLKK